MHWSIQQIGEMALSALCILAIVIGLVMWFRRVQDKKALLIRLGISAVLTGLYVEKVIPLLKKGGPAAVAAIFFTVAFGWLMAFIWVPAVTGWVGGLFGGLFDGGNKEIEPKPFYSIFKAKRTKGKYFEALAEVRRQLDKFPTDFEGHMLLAELQAENLNDLPGAEVTIRRLCAQPEQTPQNKSYALNRLADWHLGLTKDRESAQRTLETLIDVLPGTEMALRAAQRIGHLADNEMLLAPVDRERVEVKKGVRNLGLLRGEDGKLRVPQVDQEKLAEEYVAQLERHPQDSHAREKLAEIYAKHYHRLDLAVEQLEQLIQQPGHPARQVAHWLNMMADLQVFEGADIESVRITLQRIIDLFPETAAAQKAQRRMDVLKLEARAKEKVREVRLGTYEQNIGLKRRNG